MPRRSPKAATEIQQFDREARAIEMRAAGHNFQSIADTLGYADASGASKAYHRALARKPAQNVNEIRAQEAERIEYLWHETSKVIERPPVKTTSTGFNQYDPRTGPCTCGGIKNGPRTDHSPQCAVKPILDERAKIAAISEYRKLSESFRDMTGADLTAPKQPDLAEQREVDEFNSYIAYLMSQEDEARSLKRENTDLKIQLSEALRADAVI